LNSQVLELKTLRVRIGLGVLQEVKEEADRLLGPATCQIDQYEDTIMNSSITYLG
jgi:hypothetical protein